MRRSASSSHAPPSAAMPVMASSAASSETILRHPAVVHRIANLEAQVSSLTDALAVAPPPSSMRLEDILISASTSPQLAHHRIKTLVRHICPTHPILVRIASLCLTGPVGSVGDRRALRVVANLILDAVLKEAPNFSPANCLKGEAMIPVFHYGHNDPFTPLSLFTEASYHFKHAIDAGDPLGIFLQGRWLLSNESLHKNAAESLLGRKYIDDAAEKGCARASTFLAHRYENLHLDDLVSFKDDLPKGQLDRERFIFSHLIRAAELGDANALNDIATSYTEGYAALPVDFDLAVTYYLAAIRAGSLIAFDNLGTHYETGMGGKCPDRVDNSKALYYYRQGMKNRCAKCAYNLGSAYEEGMEGVLPRDLLLAERYYMYSLTLADDANDPNLAGYTLHEMTAMFFTSIKLDSHNGATATRAFRKLRHLLGEQLLDQTMARLNAAITSAKKSKSGRVGMALRNLIGDSNGKHIIVRVREMLRRKKVGRDVEAEEILRHMEGLPPVGFDGDMFASQGAKRPARPAKSATRKRRKVSS